MRNLVAFPILALAVILQSSVVSQVRLLSGYADLLLVMLAAWSLQERVDSTWHWGAAACLMIGFASNLPLGVILVGYFGVLLLARVLQRRVWQAPLLAMFSVVFFGTLFFHILSVVVLRFLGTPFAFGEVIGLITLPSLLLNMLLAIPVYSSMRELSHWVYPLEDQA